jgi:F-type H+-transporting ATPase subunit epsilon
MKIEIITPEKTIYRGEVEMVQLPGLDGLFAILNNHAPMIAALGMGRVKILDAEKTTHYFEITGGILEVLKNKVLVLAE